MCFSYFYPKEILENLVRQAILHSHHHYIKGIFFGYAHSVIYTPIQAATLLRCCPMCAVFSQFDAPFNER